MAGVVYTCCTPVGRWIIESHLKYHPDIPIIAIFNLNRDKAISKSNYDSLYDFKLKGLEVIYCEDVNMRAVLDFLKEVKPTLLIQSGWSQKFGKELLSIPKYGCIGQHPAPLPIGRGAACINWAILEGQKEWGDSFFQMVEEYDKGAVHAQVKFTIEDYDDVKTVYEKVNLTSFNIIRDNLHKWYRGEFDPFPFDETKATYYKQRKPEDGEIDLSWDVMKIYNYVRALTKPYPGAFFYYKGQKVFVWEAKFSSGKLKLEKLQIEGLPEFYGKEFFGIK